MNRIKDMRGTVHFSGTNDHTLCGVGVVSANLLRDPEPIMRETTESVTCASCARLYCRIKNAPWNEVDGHAMEAAIVAAVEKNHDQEDENV